LRRTVRYLDLADFLLIAEAVLGVEARELIHAARLDLAESRPTVPRTVTPLATPRS